MLSLRPLLAHLTIQAKKTRELKTLNLYSNDEYAWAQGALVDAVESQYNAGKPVRIITLKARQLGISTVTEGILFWWAFLHKGTNGLVLANEQSTAQELFQKTKLYWDTWPFKPLYSIKYSTRNQMYWDQVRSGLRIATAKNVQSGRGSTISALHATEAAFYPDPETLMGGLNQAIPYDHGTIIVLESTAKGVGNWWHSEWLKAEQGESEYYPLFLPWYKHSEYVFHSTSINTRLELSPYERWLLKLGATYENIAWRRWAIRNQLPGGEDQFFEEYPAVPEEAFVHTGRPVFALESLKECFVEDSGYRGYLIQKNGKYEFRPDKSGSLVIFKKPHPTDLRTDRYFVAGDPSRTVTGDPSCIQVLNRQTMEQVAVWHGHCDPKTFAHEMMKIGYFYNSAMLCPEAEGGGQGTVFILLDRNYPQVWMHKWPDKSPGKVANSFGWYTNWDRKQFAIGTLNSLLLDHSLKLHDRKTYDQLWNYVVKDNGDLAPADNNDHDDAVMALAIGVAASKMEGPFLDYSDKPPVLELFEQQAMYEEYDPFREAG